jgi:GMP synthase-like glutamine amidotransferase
MEAVTRILVFQHHPLEHPGSLRDFLAADGIRWDPVRLDAGAPIPPLEPYDALWVMGGPQDVWQEDRHPWLKTEKAAIRAAVAERGMPYLGICLGHQLLADALGGKVEPMKGRAEIGVREVALTPAGEADAVLGGDGPRLTCLQWHAAEVTALPEGAEVLAASSMSAIQAMRVGRRAYGLQFHLEATAATVPEWAGIPAYRRALERGLGAGELADFEANAVRRAPEFRRSARRLYDRFMALVPARAQ